MTFHNTVSSGCYPVDGASSIAILGGEERRFFSGKQSIYRGRIKLRSVNGGESAVLKRRIVAGVLAVVVFVILVFRMKKKAPR
jgi:hypothetical protein